jgi:hypothetical protein
MAAIEILGPHLSSSEIYNPAADGSAPGTWVSTCSLASPYWAHTVTVLNNGMVLVTGGEIYNPGSGKWTPTGLMLTSLYESATLLLPNGQVFTCGGKTRDGLPSRGAESINSP